jgi:electron transfer flavoprotein alpha subunit
MPQILAVAEMRDDTLRAVSKETVSAARTLADARDGETHAILLGRSGTAEAARALVAVGADVIFTADGDDFAGSAPDILAAVIAAHIRDGGYDAVVFAATPLGKDVAPRVAAKLDVPLAADATDLGVEGGSIVVTRPIYGGRAFAKVEIDAQPALLSVRPNVFRPGESKGRGEMKALQAAAGKSRVRVVETKAASADRPDVGEAPIVVSGGRGMKGPENWHLLEQLVDALGSSAALGASRAVVDSGWRPHAEQVGQTGKTVSPQLYFAVAISGAMQHLAGMRSAKTIVAINKDADAPIFKVADYGLVGDVAEVLPALSEEIRRARGG